MLRAFACALIACSLLPAAAQSTPQTPAADAKPQDKTQDASKDAKDKQKPAQPPKKNEPPPVTETIIPMQDAPKMYRAVYTDARFGPTFTITIQRNESRVVVDRVMSGGTRTRTFYDLDQQTRLTWTPPSAAGNCVSAAISGDWGDPFASSIFNGMDTHFAGNEILRGVNTNVMEGPAASGGTVRAWFDAATNLLLRAVETAPGANPTTIVELVSLDRATPPADTFAVPGACNTSASPDDLRAHLITGRAAGYPQANLPIDTIPPESCKVTFRVVLGNSLTPITRGFQTAVDLAIDPAHFPAYDIEVTPEGHATFAGGQLHEVTADFHSGALQLDNVPAVFEIDTEFGAGGSAHALIRRQCAGPENTLLLIVRDPANPSDASAWVWAHAAKATPKP
jgi:hypothetical protein